MTKIINITLLCRNICVCQKKVVPLHQIYKTNKQLNGAATRNSGEKVMKKQSNYYWIYNSCGKRTELNPIIASNLKEAAQKAKELTKNIPGHFGVSRDYSGGVNGSAAGIKISWY